MIRIGPYPNGYGVTRSSTTDKWGRTPRVRTGRGQRALELPKATFILALEFPEMMLEPRRDKGAT
jgi:hypothetical protein